MRILYAHLKKLLLTASPLSQQRWECSCSKRVVVNAVCYSPLGSCVLGLAIPFHSFFGFFKKKL